MSDDDGGVAGRDGVTASPPPMTSTAAEPAEVAPDDTGRATWAAQDSAAAATVVAPSDAPRVVERVSEERRQNIRDVLRAKQQQLQQQLSNDAAPGTTSTTNTTTTSSSSLSSVPATSLTTPAPVSAPATSTLSSATPASLPSSTMLPQPPPQQPREDLVAAATAFLQSEKVRAAPLQSKIDFLKSKKGMTDDEVAIAMQRATTAASSIPPLAPANSTATVTTASAAPLSTVGPSSNPAALATQAYPQPYQQALPPPPPQSYSQPQFSGMPPPGQYYYPPPPPSSAVIPQKAAAQSPSERYKNIALTLIFGGGLSWLLVRSAVRTISTAYLSFRSAYAANLASLQARVAPFLDAAVRFCELYRTATPPTSSPSSSDAATVPAAASTATADPQMQAASDGALVAALTRRPTVLQDALRDVIDLAADYRLKLDADVAAVPADTAATDDAAAPAAAATASSDSALRALSAGLVDLSAYAARSSAYRPYPVFGGYTGLASGPSDAGATTADASLELLQRRISDTKAEVRALKGMLLSRRNFPSSASATLAAAGVGAAASAAAGIS
ncbi:hypothetical protein HK405_005886 [Cladochytrium tenue]|nr:hypothetical protein HK405_005886 [Cladochytrium tenue]